VALAVRLVPVLLAINLGIGLDDMFQYDMLARSLAEGKGYRWYSQPDLEMLKPYIAFDFSQGSYDPQGVLTSFRAPLYPLFLAAVYKLSGLGFQRFLAVRLTQALLGALLAPLTYLVARGLASIPDEGTFGGFHPPNVPSSGYFFLPPARELRAAKIAAWVVAFYPMLVLYPLGLATENLFFVTTLLSILALLKAQRSASVSGGRGELAWFAAAGVFLGLAALTRSIIIGGILLAAAWTWFIARRHKGVLVLLLGVLLTVSPWVVRNSLLYGHFTWIETSLGYNLYLGYHPQGNGSFQVGISFDLLKIMNDDQRDQVGRVAAWQFVRANPQRALSLVFSRLGYFFDLERRALTYFYSNDFFGYIPLPLLLSIALLVLLPFVVVSTSTALSLARPWTMGTWLVALFSLGYMAPNILVLAEDRFHLVLVPLMAILAAQVWTSLPQYLVFWHTRRGIVALALAVCLIALLFLNWGLDLHRDAARLAQLLGPNGNQSHFPY
jgi:4-amino-4-deoxy-L-arabinose transferase-like glycosyltransferase